MQPPPPHTSRHTNTLNERNHEHLDTIGNVKQLVSEIMNCTALHKKYTVPQLLTVLLACKHPLKSTLFRKLFLKVHGHLLSRYSIYIPDRIPVRIPIPDRNLLLALKAEFARLLSSSSLPSPPTAWLVDCITVTPQKSRKVHQCLRGARIHKTTEEMAMKLQSEKGTLVRLRGLNVGTLFTRKPQQLRKKLQENPPLQTQNCSCTELKLLFHIPCGEQQDHIVLRNNEQWAAFHAGHKVFTQNARNTTLPTRAQLDMCMHTFATSVAPILHTKGPRFTVA